MTPNLQNHLRAFVESNIPEFHQRRLDSLNGLQLKDVLKNKNPYLFKAKNIVGADDLVKSILDAHISSQEESIFGEFLEKVAIEVCRLSLGGRKSGIDGMDLEFENEGVLHVVSIKSGPKWHNKAQLDKLRDDFRKARRTLNTNAKSRPLRLINGCCYGRAYSDRGDFEKICGEEFWTLISGDSRLYIDLIHPLGFEAKRRNEEFDEAYAKVRTKFTSQFVPEFCDSSYAIDWEKIIVLNSSMQPKRKKKQ